MKLYYTPGASSLSPHIVACEAGLPLELVKVDLQSKRTETGEDFRQLNPDGYIPLLLLDDGKRLTEGPAIVQYLADLAPDRKLAPPSGSFERYQLQQWLNFISTEIHKNFIPLFNPVASEDTKKQAIAMLMTRLKSVAEHLSSGSYLLGEQFSVADIYLYVTLSWGQYVNLDTSQWPAFSRYMDRIAERPAVQQAMKEEGLIQ
jgi:glutathione S-transferase